MSGFARVVSKAGVFALAVTLLAACQTVPDATGFTSDQVVALESAGFSRVSENYELGLDNRVLFEFDSSNLQPDAFASLGALARVLVSARIYGATVEGHTDSDGANDYNQTLSEARASAVKAQLASEGLTDERIRAFGLGETDPVASNETEIGKAQNRRVVIVITPADAMPVKVSN